MGFGDATLAYGYWALAPVETRAEAVVLNALPSARHLSAARTALTEYEEATRPALLPDGRGPLHAGTWRLYRCTPGSTRRVAAELATPEFPGEAALAREMVRSLEALDARTSELLAATTAPSEVRLARTRAWLTAATQADDAIARVARFNIGRGDQGRATRSDGFVLSIHKRAEAITLADVRRHAGRRATVAAVR